MGDPRSIRIDKHPRSQLHLEEEIANFEHGFKFKIKWNSRLYKRISGILSAIGATVCACDPYSLQ